MFAAGVIEERVDVASPVGELGIVQPKTINPSNKNQGHNFIL
jgi:hypothetical protein